MSDRPAWMRPVVIDLYCGAGGAAKGYQRAGFYVIGVDLDPQPNYCGDTFVQMDALEFMAILALVGKISIPGYGTLHIGDVVLWHGSPPCQKFSTMSNCRPGLADTYPDLVGQTRDFFRWLGGHYVIENVPGSPLRNPVMLCGQMVSLDLYRHRLFETNWLLRQPEHPKHVKPASRAGHWKPGTVMSVSGHVSPMWKAREAMGGIDWMTRDELAESIPAQFTELVGEQLLAHVAQEIAA